MNGIDLITRERKKQIAKGYNSKHDEEHDDGSLVTAACTIALNNPISTNAPGWAWQLINKHPNKLDRLAIAGALIAAEIDRVLGEMGKEDALREAGIL
jgi:hypothetical protein